MTRHPSTLSEMAKRLSTETGHKHTECLRALERVAQQVVHPDIRYAIAYQEVSGEAMEPTDVPAEAINAMTRREQAFLLSDTPQPFSVPRWLQLGDGNLGVWATDREVRLDFLVHLLEGLANWSMAPVIIPTRDRTLVDPVLADGHGVWVVDLSNLPGGASGLMSRLDVRDRAEETYVVIVEASHGLLPEDNESLVELTSFSSTRRGRLIYSGPPKMDVQWELAGAVRKEYEAVLLDDDAVQIVGEYCHHDFPAEDSPPRPAVRGGGLYLCTSGFHATRFGPAPPRTAARG